MNLRSLIKSSGLEIILSKRIAVVVYSVIGISILAHMVSSCLQFWNAYHHLGEFDVTPNEFLIIAILFFLPFWTTGALILRAVIQRMRLAIWARRSFRIVGYSTKLLPAEAGLLVDYEYNNKELVATLLDLHYKNYLTISINHGQVYLSRLEPVNPNTTSYETELMNHLFKGEQSRVFSSLSDPALLSCGAKAHLTLVSSMQSDGKLRPEKRDSPAVRNMFRIVYSIAGLIGIASICSLIFAYDEVSSVVYPRFPVHVLQLWLLGILVIFVSGVMLSGFWPRLKDTSESDHMSWMEAVGFMGYLKMVFASRFESDMLQTQDPDTIKSYLPYAVAFGVVPIDEKTIANAIVYAK